MDCRLHPVARSRLITLTTRDGRIVACNGSPSVYSCVQSARQPVQPPPTGPWKRWAWWPPRPNNRAESSGRIRQGEAGGGSWRRHCRTGGCLGTRPGWLGLCGARQQTGSVGAISPHAVATSSTRDPWPGGLLLGLCSTVPRLEASSRPAFPDRGSENRSSGTRLIRDCPKPKPGWTF